MSDEIKVGDVCEIVNAIENEHLNGRECVVLENAELVEIFSERYGFVTRLAYKIHVEGERWPMYAERSELRKKRPPADESQRIRQQTLPREDFDRWLEKVREADQVEEPA